MANSEEKGRARDFLSEWRKEHRSENGLYSTIEMLADHALLERAEAIEECAKRVEAMIGSLAVSEDRARADGRHGVADCRQSDIETCERAAANIRALTPAPEAEKEGRKI